MAVNKGKQWEDKFKKDFEKLLTNKNGAKIGCIIRLKDQVSKYKGTSSNPCDFICFILGLMFLVECKSVKKGKTFSISGKNFKQYEDLLNFKNITGVCPYVIIWFREFQKVIAVRINEIEKMKLDKKKSINLKMLGTQDYEIIEIPSVLRRVFLDCDYSILVSTEIQKLNL